MWAATLPFLVVTIKTLRCRAIVRWPAGLSALFLVSLVLITFLGVHLRGELDYPFPYHVEEVLALSAIGAVTATLAVFAMGLVQERVRDFVCTGGGSRTTSMYARPRLRMSLERLLGVSASSSGSDPRNWTLQTP